MMLLKADHVSKTYGSGRTAVKALQDVTLHVQAGDIVLLMGPSGSGKTTLLSIIGTLLRPSTGSVTVNQQVVSELPEDKLAKVRLGQIGFVFQSFNLLSALSAEQNVMVPFLAAGKSKSQAKAIARRILTQLHLGQRLQNLPRNLSGGEKQRVAIARALVNDPQIILADEPTANLDSATGHEVAQLLCEIACSQGKAVIIASHDPRLKNIAKSIVTVTDGKIVSQESGGHDSACKMNHKKTKPLSAEAMLNHKVPS